MKALILMSFCVLLLVGCTTSEKQIQEALKNNPDLLFEVIKDNPEKFLAVVNEAAKAAQYKQYEKQIAEQERQRAEDLKNPKKPELSTKRRLLGNDNSKITVVEYADFQCPACKMAHSGLKEFLEKHKGNVELYYKNLPLDFHDMAYPAAAHFEAILLQSPSKAYAFFNHVFENQASLKEEGFLSAAAKKVGADMKQLKSDLQSEKVKRAIEKDMAEFQKFGFTGTPVVLINGVALHGAQSFDELERVLKLTQK